MVPCPVCSLSISLASRGKEESLFCPGCRREVRGIGWPALDRSVRSTAVPSLAATGQAVCFSCPTRAATGVCDACGCYTCPACEAPWFGESLCLGCLHSRREKQAAPRYRTRIWLYDNIALGVLVLPIVFIPFYGLLFAVLASPLALYLVIRHRRASRGLPPRGPLRLVLAGVLSALLLLGVLVGVGAMGVAVFAGSQTVSRAMDAELPDVVEDAQGPGGPAGEAEGGGSSFSGEGAGGEEP